MKNKLTFIILLFSITLSSQMKKFDPYFKAGGIISSKTSGIEFVDYQVGATYMFNQTIGLNLLGDYANTDTWKFQHINLEGVLSSDGLSEDPNFTFLLRAGVAYMFTDKYATMPIFEESNSIKLSLGLDLIYWISPTIGINAYVDYIPFISQNDSFECNCVEYEINNKADILTAGLGLRFAFGKPLGNRYLDAIDKVDKKVDKADKRIDSLRNDFNEHKKQPLHDNYIFPKVKEEVWFVMFEKNQHIPSEWSEAKEVAYYFLMHQNKNIELIAGASTEGTIWDNERLAERRADTIELILMEYGISKDRIKKTIVGEKTESKNDLDKFKPLDRNVLIKIL